MSMYRTAPESESGCSIGEFTYGTPTLVSWGEPSELTIGKFCSIANNVRVYLGGNHRSDWVSTYPFPVLMAAEWPEISVIEGHPGTRGDVVVGNDVWLADNSTIMSGVTIGDGAKHHIVFDPFTKGKGHAKGKGKGKGKGKRPPHSPIKASDVLQRLKPPTGR